MNQSETILQRWSRLKLESRESAPVSPQGSATIPNDPGTGLDALFQPDVPGEVRQQALRKLFMTDHYRAMDGLDVYVDDYSQPELLSAELLEKLDHVRSLLNADAPEQQVTPREPGELP